MVDRSRYKLQAIKFFPRDFFAPNQLCYTNVNSGLSNSIEQIFPMRRNEIKVSINKNLKILKRIDTNPLLQDITFPKIKLNTSQHNITKQRINIRNILHPQSTTNKCKQIHLKPLIHDKRVEISNKTNELIKINKSILINLKKKSNRRNDMNKENEKSDSIEESMAIFTFGKVY